MQLKQGYNPLLPSLPPKLIEAIDEQNQLVSTFIASFNRVHIRRSFLSSTSVLSMPSSVLLQALENAIGYIQSLSSLRLGEKLVTEHQLPFSGVDFNTITEQPSAQTDVDTLERRLDNLVCTIC